jgi:hypothetical protein
MPRGGRRGGRAAGRSRVRRMTRRMAMRRRRRRRRRRILLVGGMIAVGYAGYKLSKRDVKRVEEHTGQDADELTDEQLEQAMDQLGIDKETMSDDEWAAAEKADAEKADAEPSYLDELERLGQLRDQGIITDEEFEAKKKNLLDQ